MTNVYHYMPETGEFVTSTVAHIDPLAKTPRLPGHATFDAPPAAEDGKARVFDEESETWSQVEDHRNELYWLADGSQRLVTGLGPVPDEALGEAPVLPITKAQVMAERNRRIAAGFLFEGKLFQSDPDSLVNISGASTSALGAMMGGVAPDHLNWADPDNPFVWMASDNTLVSMGPAKVLTFGNAAMAHKSAHIFAARALKALDPIPQNYADDVHWP